MNIFTPDYKLDIISDEEYPKKITDIEKTLQYYAAEGILRRSDNMTLAWRYFLVEGAHASVIIVHGFTEFYLKYDEICWYLMKMGYNVFIYDQRGHGLSGREVDDEGLAHVRDFNDYADDLAAVIDSVVLPVSGDLPLYALTHSMGGGVVSLYLIGGGTRLEKVAMTSPMISPRTGGIPVNIAKKMILHDAMKSSWDSRFRFSGEFCKTGSFRKSSDMSYVRYEHIRELRMSDKRYQCCSSTNSWVWGAVCLNKRIFDKKAIKKVKAKVMIISAGRDRVVKNSRQRQFSRALDCPMITFKGAKHSIFVSGAPVLNKYLDTVLTFFAE